MADLLESSGLHRSLRQTEVTELFSTEVDSSLSGGDDVVIRRLANGGEFAHTVTCLPGAITILPAGKDGEAFAPFRDALIGKETAASVSIRCGSHELHNSEIHVVSNADVLAPGLTVQRVFDELDITKEEQQQALAAIGLHTDPDTPTQDLSRGVLRRLAIVAALYTRSRVMVFDDPFQEVESEWVPALAGMILSAVSNSSQIAIVTGLLRVPRVWKSSPSVVQAGVEVGARQGDTYIVEETIGYLTKIRQLIGRNGGVEEDDGLITTYPQRIFRRRRNSSNGSLLVEAIQNPNVTEEEPQSEDGEGWSAETRARVRDSKVLDSVSTSGMEKKRRASGRLTKVTGLHRMKGSKWYLVAMNTKQFSSMLRSDGARHTGAARWDHDRQNAERTDELEKMLFLVLLLQIALLFADLFSR